MMMMMMMTISASFLVLDRSRSILNDPTEHNVVVYCTIGHQTGYITELQSGWGPCMFRVNGGQKPRRSASVRVNRIFVFPLESAYSNSPRP